MKTRGPNAHPTGSAQPAAVDTRHEWYFDARGNYQRADFLDAPDCLPAGSVRKATEWQIGGTSFALLVGHVWREWGRP